MSKSENKNTKKSSKKINIACIVSLLLLLAGSFIMSYSESDEIFGWRDIFSVCGLTDVTTENDDTEMAVHFLNVGKADCAYIRCENSNILIDSGDKEASENIVEYLKRQRVNKLDLVVATHPHRDHIGQMESVIRQFEVTRFITSDIPDSSVPTSVTYKRMLEALRLKDININNVSSADTFNVGNMKIDIFGPCAKYENLNNDSVVMRITYGSISFLFMGDAEKAAEENMLKRGFNMKANVLKIGHHGSSSSTSYSFLKSVSPEYAVISVAPDKNRLPRKDVINRIKDFGIKIYRTDINGDIIFLSDGKKIKVRTQRESA